MKDCRSVAYLRSLAYEKLMADRPNPSATVKLGKVSCTCTWQHCGSRDEIRYTWTKLGKPVRVTALTQLDF
jgi:hypothetical protein